MKLKNIKKMVLKSRFIPVFSTENRITRNLKISFNLNQYQCNEKRKQFSILQFLLQILKFKLQICLNSKIIGYDYFIALIRAFKSHSIP